MRCVTLPSIYTIRGAKCQQVRFVRRFVCGHRGGVFIISASLVLWLNEHTSATPTRQSSSVTCVFKVLSDNNGRLCHHKESDCYSLHGTLSEFLAVISLGIHLAMLAPVLSAQLCADQQTGDSLDCNIP